MAENTGGGNQALKGGREEGAPLTVNLMTALPGSVEPSLDQALLIGRHTAAVNVQGVEDYDFRNYRRSHRFPRNRGTIR